MDVEQPVAGRERNAADTLGRFAAYQQHKRHNADAAESLYKRAIEADPTHANNLGSYAVFLETDRDDADAAETYYKRAIEADPKHAVNLGNYALFLKNRRSDARGAERHYERALAADPGNAYCLGGYAVLVFDIHHDADRAEDYFKRALAADSQDADILGSYALFLETGRNDRNSAQTYYERALELDPAHAHVEAQYATFMQAIDGGDDDTDTDAPDANMLGAYAYLLHHDRQEPDEAEAYYERAIAADPKHARNLANYAVFLQTVRHDPDHAEPFYERALDAGAGQARIAGNYAGILLSAGKTKEGLRHLEAARKAGPEPALALELAFYQYAHDPDPAHRKDGLATVRRLLREGTRSPGWSGRRNVEQAKRSGHPEPKFVSKLALVIADGADVSALTKFECWHTNRAERLAAHAGKPTRTTHKRR